MELNGEKYFCFICFIMEYYYYFICLDCGGMKEIIFCLMDFMNKDFIGYEVMGYKFEIYGCCLKCVK